ncbi:hypothetical protein SEUCBS139899_004429 [Sporothrix eucalyptigena]|uniref:Uncharacterized protein n=1 Tax=Sporothrix eucalyptigena TaxID=1812306 RepID=A0ABP0D123_9PEZI
MPDLSKATIQRRALLQVCREARTEVLKLWNSMMTLERGGIVRFSFEFDMVYLDIVNPLVVEDLVELRIKNDLPAWATVIGHVGFDMTPSMPLWLLHHESDLEPRASFIMCFPNLHSLSLVSFGAFQTEIDWSSREDSNWIISRTRSHSVYLRGFPAIEQCDYSAPCAVGKRTTGLRDKHDCAICTIHKCVYVHQFVGKKARNARLMAIPGLTAENKDWLRQLKHYTLIASTPGMIARIPAYTINTAGWWINRPEARQRLLGETGGDDEDNSESEAHGHSSDDEDENDDDGHDHHHGGFLPGDNNGDHAGHHHGDEDDDDEESDHDHDEDSDDGDFFVN